MDVGTAKPTAEQRARVPHHLLDLVEPSEPFSVAAFQAAAREAADDVRRRGPRPLLVGGSGLYFRAVVDELEFPGTEPETRGTLEGEAAALGPDRMHRRLAELDPVAASKIDPANVRRTVRALEVAAITGNPFSSYAAAWESYPPERVRVAGIGADAGAARRSGWRCGCRRCSRPAGSMRSEKLVAARVRRLAHLLAGHRLR